MTQPDSARRIEDLFDRVWDTLDLPTPTIRRFEDRWHWSRWEEAEAYGHWHRDAFSHWTSWRLLEPRNADQAVTDPDMGARVRRWNALRSQDQPGAEPAFTEVAALRALDFLREIEELCRDNGRNEELAICLTVQAVLLARALGREEEAEQMGEEAWALNAGEEGWRVHATVEQVLRFLNGEGPAGDYLGWSSNWT